MKPPTLISFETKYTLACGQEIEVDAEVTLKYDDKDTDVRYISHMDLTVNGCELTEAGEEAITDEDWAAMHQHVIDESAYR